MGILRHLLFVLMISGTLLLGPTPCAQAWNEYDHHLISELGLAQVAKRQGLGQQVKITSLKDFLDKAANRLDIEPTPLAFALYLKNDPAVDIAALPEGQRVGGSTTPHEIMTHHATDPDDGRDKKQFQRDAKGQLLLNAAGEPIPLYKNMLFMGGANGQAYRHMEKPPISIRSLSSTFGYPFGELGVASDQAQRYFDLAVVAWEVGAPYWAWRFLACASHYVQDINQPYHATQFASHGRYLWRTFRVWLGTPNTGLIEAITALISNSHHFYEDLVAHHTRIVREGIPADERAARLVAALDSDTLGQVPSPSGPERRDQIRRYMKAMRDASNRRAPDLLEAIYYMSGPQLLSTYDYPQPGDYVESFLRPQRDSRFLVSEERFFAISRQSLALAGEATRTLVATFLDTVQ